jgi:hypothetical protein
MSLLRRMRRAQRRVDPSAHAPVTARTPSHAPRTYWNGQPTPCRRVVVRVGHAIAPTWWCAGMEGQERAAVEVAYFGQPFFLDDEDGSGWTKVTDGRGSPHFGHRSLPDDSVVLRVRE